MTAFHITLALIILFLIIFSISYRFNKPWDWVEMGMQIFMSMIVEAMVIGIGIAIYSVGYKLWTYDWYGFFHDIVINFNDIKI